MNFKKSICWRFNLHNDNMISVFVNMYVACCDTPPGLKTGLENAIFWSEG